jgi:peptide deformylase
LILEIRTDGAPVLREIAQPVKVIDGKMRNLASDMLETMYSAPGVGLAAPQVGVGVRLIVIDAGDGPRTLFNPEIVWRRGEACDDEGCLSVPGMVGTVTRSAEVEVIAYDRNGELFNVKAKNLLARILQHEIDHLDGILYIDKAENVRPVEDECKEDQGNEGD